MGSRFCFLEILWQKKLETSKYLFVVLQEWFRIYKVVVLTLDHDLRYMSKNLILTFISIINTFYFVFAIIDLIVVFSESYNDEWFIWNKIMSQNEWLILIYTSS